MTSALALSPIIVAEDDSNDLFFFRQALTSGGISNPLVVLGNGVDVIEHLKRICLAPEAARPRLLFLDLHLPQIDGRGVIAWVKHQPLLRSLRIVVVSGSGEPEDLSAAAALGADRVVTKPISAALLAAEISRINAPDTSAA
jgi:CheY-like chemotaxis protein